MLLSGLDYKYKSGGCNDKTQRHLKVQIYEHLGISRLTGKKVKIDKNKLPAVQNTSYIATILHPLKTFLF